MTASAAVMPAPAYTPSLIGLRESRTARVFVVLTLVGLMLTYIVPPFSVVAAPAATPLPELSVPTLQFPSFHAARSAARHTAPARASAAAAAAPVATRTARPTRAARAAAPVLRHTGTPPAT